jgi:hypothetical protein
MPIPPWVAASSHCEHIDVQHLALRPASGPAEVVAAAWIFTVGLFDNTVVGKSFAPGKQPTPSVGGKQPAHRLMMCSCAIATLA